ncbi:site-specific integrase [Craterilacuibacter sinensis]|uniref:Tyrosine-type recombinase/integrase n=1 Tax=Craterilacuibacter sinensis TaxID=2686017 RepID=A0A845BJK2_9NEIS|nr:site-specific integrase [Craterilacuibacter sinensis]MXR36359.1 tyrosine-type recombinase/integrase [Craterilacuibacter sinensis]
MASITRRGPYQFQAIIRRKGYPSQTRTFETRTDAEAWVRSVESKMDHGQFRDLRPLDRLTLGDLLQRYADEVTPSKRGVVQERTRINKLLRHSLALRPMSTLRASDFAAYRNERLEQVSASTVRLELALLSHLYTMAIREWSLPLEHALQKITRPKSAPGRERRLQRGELACLFAAIETQGGRAGPWLKACIQLALETGMRAGELLSLEWRQVDLASAVIKLEMTKNGTARLVPLSEKAEAVLAALPQPGLRVIPNFYDTSGLDRAFKRACQVAGIEGLRFHDLRHEAASRRAPHVTPQTLAKLFGWKNLQMSMRYYNPQIAELHAAIGRTSLITQPG